MTGRARFKSVLPIIMLFLSVAASRAAEPFVRVQVETPQPVSVGQQVTVDVKVFVPNFFLGAPQFPALDIPGAIVTLPDQGAVNLTETINGETFAGIQRSYVITPLQPGNLSLPPARIGVTYAAIPGQRTEASVALPYLTVSVEEPKGAQGAFLAVDLTMTQSLDRDPAGLKRGDTLARTITIAARGIQAMMIPPPEFAPVPSLTLYPQQPILHDDSRDRSGLVGASRTDKMLYRFDQPGDYILPALTLDWFDPGTKQRAQASAPAIAVKVATLAAFEAEIAPDNPVPSENTPRSTMRDWLWRLALAVSVLSVAGLSFWLSPRIRADIAVWRAKRRESEAAYFSRVRTACRSGSREDSYRALGAWAHRADALSPSDWLNRNGDPELKRLFAALEQQLFGPIPATAPWDAEPFLSTLTKARKNWLEADRHKVPRGTALPDLNPRFVSHEARPHDA